MASLLLWFLFLSIMLYRMRSVHKFHLRSMLNIMLMCKICAYIEVFAIKVDCFISVYKICELFC